MDYEQAMDFLEETKKYGSIPGLESITHLMERLGNVQDKVPAVHVAGTNGKGAVSAMTASVLAEAGYRTGRFSTPDVFSYEEEFLINEIPVSRESLAGVFTEVSKACEQLVREGFRHPTRFEVETAAAFLWFYEEKCDIAVIETGMGGKDDATNIIKAPLASVITSVSMDHMNFLGNTLEEIAQAKAGIIKENCPVITAPLDKAASAVIEKECRNKNAGLYKTSLCDAKDIRQDNGYYSFLYKDMGRVMPAVRGSFQTENALCALKVLEVISERYNRLDKQAVISGLKNVYWPGRFQLIYENPDFYVDGAHNPGAAGALKNTLKECLPGKRIIYIMGVLADKDYEKIADIMFEPGDRVFAVTPENPRALDAKTLSGLLILRGVNAKDCAKVKDAVLYALSEAKEDDVVLAFGSLSYLKDIKDALPPANKK